MKLEHHFPILDKGVETVANILGVYVYEEDIYMPVVIESTNEFKVFQILPGGIKVSSKKVKEEFYDFIFAPEVPLGIPNGHN